jgi:hypothetical protein
MQKVNRLRDSKIAKLVREVQSNLTPELLKPRWKNQRHPLEGFCYVAAEAMYHLLGKEDWKPCMASYEDEGGKTSHWWLAHKTTGRIVDPTHEQFTELGKVPPHHLGKGCGFLTQQPSKRAQRILDRVYATQTRQEIPASRRSK